MILPATYLQQTQDKYFNLVHPVFATLKQPSYIVYRLIYFVEMSDLRRQKNVSDLCTQDGSDDQENVDLSVTSPDISDPRIFMITEHISRYLHSSFKGLETTMGLPLLPHQNMPFAPMMEIHSTALPIHHQNMSTCRRMIESPLTPPNLLE